MLQWPVLLYGFGFCISDLKYNISYNLYGGEVETKNPSYYTEKTEEFTLNNPSKEGYTFKGWSGTGLVGDENLTVTIEKGSTGDREYIANYIPNTYQIQFNANGGTGSISNQTMVYDLEQNLTKNIFTRAGYTFKGWNTIADGTGTSYSDEEKVINLTVENNGVVTLYAQWEALPVRYAVQIYGINQDVDEDNNVLGLTFGPATGADYNNAYVTHRYVANAEGTFNIEIVTTTVDANGDEAQTIETLLNSNDEPVTRTAEQVAQRQNINLHEMSWSEIAATSDKTLFEDCMLCGDTKKVELVLNDQLKTGQGYNQFGDGAGLLRDTVKAFYRRWNPNSEQNAYVGSEESDVELNEFEVIYGSNARNAGGYSSSHIRATLIGENEKTNRGYAGDDNLTVDTCVFSCIQEDLKNLIVPKKIKYETGTNYTEGNYTINTDISDLIWLFSEEEVKGTGEYVENELEGYEDIDEAYKKFVDLNSKYHIVVENENDINSRKLYQESQTIIYWWLRSIQLNFTYRAAYVYSSGTFRYYYSDNSFGLRFWFLP